MLKMMRKGQRWLTALFVVAIGGVFAVFIGIGGPMRRSSGPSDAVLQVGPYRVGAIEFERTREQREAQYQKALGDKFDPHALGSQIDNLTARILVERSILALEAQRLGLSVSNHEIEQDILSQPGFRDENGKFNRENFRGWVSYEFGSERNFVEEQRRLSLANKLLRVIEAQAHVSDGEAREAVERRLEQVRIAFVVLGGDSKAPALPRDDKAVAAYLASHEAEVRKLYDERSDEFDLPERTRARHILLRVPADATPDQVAKVEARAKAVRARLVAGEDFAAVAREVSEDPGSAQNGGDLGYFRRGQMVPAFDEVAFSLKPGVISDLVRTPYGFHIIEVEDRKPPEVHSFEDVRSDLAFELMSREAARKKAHAEAEELAQAVQGGQSLEQAARQARLTLQRSGDLTRRPDGYVPGLGAAPEMMAVAFTLEAGQSSPRIFEVGDRLALVQVLAHDRPKPEEVDKQVAAERAKMESDRVNALADTWIAERRNQLLDSGDLIVNLKALNRS